MFNYLLKFILLAGFILIFSNLLTGGSLFGAIRRAYREATHQTATLETSSTAGSDGAGAQSAPLEWAELNNLQKFGFFFGLFGSIGALVGWIWLLLKAFPQSFPWGLSCLIVPPVSYVYGILYYDECERPTLLSFASIIVSTIGLAILRFGS